MPLSPPLDTAAQLLAQARIGHKRLPNLPDAVRPKSIEEAYACQDAVVEATLLHYGGQVAGYKVACTNVIAQQQLGVDGPFFGRLLTPFVYESPARVDPGPFFMRVIEAEFGFRMAVDLPPGRAAAQPRRDCGRSGGIDSGIRNRGQPLRQLDNGWSRIADRR